MWGQLGTLQRTNAKDAPRTLLRIFTKTLVFLMQKNAGMGIMGARHIGNVILALKEPLPTQLFSSVYYQMNVGKAFIPITI